MSKYIIKEANHYVQLERFVRDMEIITIYEPVASIQLASTFSSEAIAKSALKDLEDSGYDPNVFTIKTEEQELKEIADKKEAEHKEALRKQIEEIKPAWNNSSEEDRKDLLDKLNKIGGPDLVKEFLDEINKTSNEGE